MSIKSNLEKATDEVLSELTGRESHIELTLVGSDRADYATNASSVAAGLDISNADLESKLKEKIEKESLPVEKVEVVGPYFVNYFVRDSYFQVELPGIIKNENFGRSENQKSKVILEYSQPNIAKKMHVGHLRNTVLGDALANIFEYAGYEVIRWNYLGDWGTQFGKLIAAYKLWGSEANVKKAPLDTLLNLYVRFHEEMKNDPSLESRGREEFKKLEAGDSENKKLWEWFRNLSLGEFNRIYNRLGVKFDVDIGESFYEKDLKEIVESLLSSKIAEESDGAIIVKLDEENLPPALIQKSDGTSLYLTRDIANINYRFKIYNPSKIIYVVGNEQSLHFQQLFAIEKRLGINPDKLRHIKYGLVLGEEGKKLATREGRTIFVEEVIEKAVSLARQIVEEKNASLNTEEKDRISEAVGIGALKYELLKENKNTDITFNWKKMLDFGGAGGPYIQYAYARLANIINKASKIKDVEADCTLLNHPIELKLIKHALNFPDIVVSVAEDYSVNKLTLYLYSLSNLIGNYYEEVRVLSDDDQKRLKARITLLKALSTVLKKGLSILGIGSPERI